MITTDELDDIEAQNDIEKEKIFIKECASACMEKDVSCDFKECKHWMNFEDDCNCDLVAISKHGSLTLREVGDRLGVSYVRIKQIEDSAIKKIKKSTTLDKFLTN